ncbi:hypothetical protein BD779DRAFT_66177 [Infundibulicybe gibba]|nr:hypothetical protein BD779DRAFT_66177 [Infundibulicybe gibba]
MSALMSFSLWVDSYALLVRVSIPWTSRSGPADTCPGLCMLTPASPSPSTRPTHLPIQDPLRFGMHVPLALLDFDSPALRCVILHLSHGYNYSWPLSIPLEWNELDAMFARRAPELECLHVRIYNQPLFEHSPTRASSWRRQMPHCLQRGILRGIDFGRDSNRKDELPLHD